MARARSDSIPPKREIQRSFLKKKIETEKAFRISEWDEATTSTEPKATPLHQP